MHKVGRDSGRSRMKTERTRERITISGQSVACKNTMSLPFDDLVKTLSWGHFAKIVNE
jgi:hypothetical protein